MPEAQRDVPTAKAKKAEDQQTMSNKRKLIATAAVVATMVTVAAGCGSSAKSASGSGPSPSAGGGHTYTVGVLTDLTGPAASGNKTSVQGVQAGVVMAKRAGYDIKYVVGDTTTSPNGALSAAQKMVQEDHVLAVIADSALTFSASNYLTSQGIPVIGAAEDGPEWMSSKNMFSVYGALDTTKVSTTYGDFFKMKGVTTVGALGYGISPASAESAKAAGVSAQHAGLKSGYVNANFQFGSTNVQPIAIAMKNAGVDGLTATVDPNTGFSLITALRQLGDNPKVALLPTGYGGDLSQAGPGALQDAQGVYFSVSFEPVEMHTPATEQFVSDLKSAGVQTEPTYAEYVGYTSVAMLDAALKAAGSDPTHSSLIDALDGLRNFSDAGLLGTHTFSPGDRASTPIGIDGCYWITELSGQSFHLVPGADPICGTEIPNTSVSASS